MAERGLEEPADKSMGNVTNRLTDCHVSQKERLKDTQTDRQTDRQTETGGQFTLSTQLVKPNYQTHRQTDRQTDSERDRQTN